jgi:hypothetical protein
MSFHWAVITEYHRFCPINRAGFVYEMKWREYEQNRFVSSKGASRNFPACTSKVKQGGIE